jgi:hypothetical protein
LLGSTSQACEVVVELLDCDSSEHIPSPCPFMTEDSCTARDIGSNPFLIKKENQQTTTKPLTKEQTPEQ